MGDVVYMLMHTADVHSKSLRRCGTVQSEKISKELNAKRSHGTAHVSDSMYLEGRTHSLYLIQREHGEKENIFGVRYREAIIVEKELCNGPEIAFVEKRAHDSCHWERKSVDALDCSLGGAVWDLFRRQDVPKLNEYLKAHFMELKTTGPHSITHPVYDQAIFLSKDQKRMLKKEYGIEPWTFRQHVGEAVFIPVGCPFQVKFLLGSSGVGFDNFLEIGPLDNNLKPRSSTWLRKANLLFVDNSVGTGYSFVEDRGLFVTSDEEAAIDLTTLLKKLYNKHKSLQKSPLYIVAESYGGKFAATVGFSVVGAVKAGEMKLKLGGVVLGDSWISLEDFVLSWRPLLLDVSRLDKNGAENSNSLAEKIGDELKKGLYRDAERMWAKLEDFIISNSNNVSWRLSEQERLDRLHQLQEERIQKGSRISITYKMMIPLAL